MKTSTQRALAAFSLFALLLAALACTCGPLSQIQGTAATAGALATEVNEGMPTFQAQATELVAEATNLAPTLNAQLTQAAEGGDIGGLELPGGEGTAQSPLGPVYDGGDGLTTILVESISIGESKTGQIDGIFDAQNWLFQGTSGQSVTIRVQAIGDTDPRAYLIDPSGNVLAEDDDSGGGAGGYDAQITFTLPADGTYTVRVDVFSGGQYTITIE